MAAPGRRICYQRCATSTTSREPEPGPSSTKARNGSLARTPRPMVACPAVERMVDLLRGADLVYLSVEVNDPDEAPFVDHLGLYVGSQSFM